MNNDFVAEVSLSYWCEEFENFLKEFQHHWRELQKLHPMEFPERLPSAGWDEMFLQWLHSSEKKKGEE